MKRPGNSKYMKTLNRMNILNIIKKNEAISRQQIAEMTGLTPPASTGIIRDLIEQGLVKESGLGLSQGGRRPVELAFHAQAAYVLGIEITSKETTLALADLQNKPELLKSFPLAMNEPQTALPALAAAVKEVLASCAQQSKKILGIGIAFPGMLTISGCDVRRAVNLGPLWRDYPIKSFLEESLGLPVFLETNSKAAALGEKWFGGGKGCENLIYINMGEGISAGIILNHNIFQGSQGYAGQIGHMVMEEDGPLCRCGNRGCLEALCGAPALLQRVRDNWQHLQENDWLNLQEKDKMTLSVGEFLQALNQQDTCASSVAKEAMRYMGMAVANMINFYNPDKVFIGGKLAFAAELFLAELHQVVRAHVFSEVGAVTPVEISAMGADSGVIGACALALRKLLHSADSPLFAFSVSEEVE